MKKIFYKDNPKARERRRVLVFCQVDGYSDIADNDKIINNKADTGFWDPASALLIVQRF